MKNVKYDAKFLWLADDIVRFRVNLWADGPEGFGRYIAKSWFVKTNNNCSEIVNSEPAISEDDHKRILPLLKTPKKVKI